MNETSRINSSRDFHGSRPSTFNSPSYDVSPSTALSNVVLPAPLGPMIPRMRPSFTLRSTSPSDGRPESFAEMPRFNASHGLTTPLFAGTPRRGRFQFLLRQAEPLNCRRNP